MFNFTRTKKRFFGLMVAIFIFVQLFGILAFAKPAQAQMDAAITAAFSGKVSADQILKSLESAALSALLQAASYFMRKLAYDAAMAVVSGGKGQGTLAFDKGASQYFKEVALDSAASAIEQLGTEFGLDLCQTPDLRLNAYLQVGLRNLYSDPTQSGKKTGTGPSARCNWQTLSDSWSADNFEEQYPGGKQFLSQTFANAIRIEDSDFGIALGAMGKIDRINAGFVFGANATRLEGAGFKPVTDIISGKIKTPAEVVKKETESISSKQSSEMSSSQIAGIYGSGSLQLLPMAASVFLNTLTSELLKKLTSWASGLLSGDKSGSSGSNNVIDFYSQQVANNRKQAEQTFGFLIASVSTQQLQNYVPSDEFAACPDNPGLNNCIIDTGLQDALQRARTNQPVTIAQALTDGMLHADWPLISPRRVTDNTDVAGCFLRGYCYSNLQKLRKARVLPIGFELAALKASPDNPQDWTLGKVVQGFDDCDYEDTNNSGRLGDTVNGVSDKAKPSTAHPFCHLIDPNWIIKSPEARCETKVVGPILTNSESAQRQEVCVDISTRIVEEENPENLGYFSYCLKEKNIWDIGGTSCEPYYNTCTTFSDRNGRLTSYLARTLDYGVCNSESVGCRAYSLEKNNGQWINSEQIDDDPDWEDRKELGRPQVLFLNDKVKNYTCSSGADGCSLFSGITDDGQLAGDVYLRRAPDYLGCYDIDLTDDEIDWPGTTVELASLADRPAECKNFAQVCLADEVGCENYRPTAGGVTIPGIVGENSCSQECVGYDTYKQEKTNFSPVVFPMYFNPLDGRACEPQYAGCDEFTNIDELNKGGEGLEYYTDLRYCERPTTNNQKTYYSWEGDANQGYVLKTHRLMPVDSEEANYLQSPGLGLSPEMQNELAVGPAYVDDNKQTLEFNYTYCNASAYALLLQSPALVGAALQDCRALYDDQGQVYYRLLKETVTVDGSCHPLRKTVSEFYVDDSISDPAICSNRGGVMQNGECNRCYRGGTYENGSCVYWTISRTGESTSCPAIANGCRAYIGNAGNNIKQILTFAFEPTGTSIDALNEAMEGWSSLTDNVNLRVRPESIVVGQYSLNVQAQVAGEAGAFEYVFATNTLERNDWYEISFWARGTGSSETVISNIYFEENGVQGRFTSSDIQGDFSVSIGTGWQQYKLGPVQFTGDGSQVAKLRFVISQGTQPVSYFFDNIQITRLDDHLYRIKDSWKTSAGYDVPLACDDNPSDAFPGAALGCKAYTNSRGVSVYATGFEKLCRPEAVGCEDLVDTRNTRDETVATAYKVWCQGSLNENCSLKYSEETLDNCIIGGQTGDCTCVPELNASGCYIDKVVLPENVYSLEYIQNSEIKPDTVFIPADTSISPPIYLTNREEFNRYCNESNLGCQKMALESFDLKGGTGETAYDFSETYYLNNPKHFITTLCQQETLGCEQYKGNNNVVFFKDPSITGNSLCTYRTLAENKSGIKVSGWFREGVGKCASNGNLCSSDADCDTGVKCDLTDLVACYPSYRLQDGTYGIWSQSSDNYQGMVGACPSEKNGCTELVDRADSASGQVPQDGSEGKPYYVIYNDLLRTSAGECQGKVSLKDGCVLFDKTDQPNKIYDSEAIYEKSVNAEPKYSSVNTDTPGSSDYDSNIILKVDRNRQCSEWLACKSSMTVWGSDNRPREVCQELGVCRELGPAGQCVKWVDSTLAASGANPLPILNEAYYVGRDVSWYGEEYSGYSLINQAGISETTPLIFPGDNTLYLGYSSDLQNNLCLTIADGETCGSGGTGRCYNRKCVYPLNSEYPTAVDMADEVKQYLEAASCKAHPELTSPYPDYLAVEQKGEQIFNAFKTKYRYEFTTKKNEYSGANVCQEGNCSCEYQKVEYKNGKIDYWPVTQMNKIPAGICEDSGPLAGTPCNQDADCNEVASCNNGKCQGGPRNGLNCNSETECVSNLGRCSLIKAESTRYGQRGFCLQPDLSRPLGTATDGQKLYACLTWLPMDSNASLIDSYNYDQSAGYLPALDADGAPGEVYCTNAAGRSYVYEHTLGLSTFFQDALLNRIKKSKYKDLNNYRIFSAGNWVVGVCTSMPVNDSESLYNYKNFLRFASGIVTGAGTLCLDGAQAIIAPRLSQLKNAHFFWLQKDRDPFEEDVFEDPDIYKPFLDTAPLKQEELRTFMQLYAWYKDYQGNKLEDITMGSVESLTQFNNLVWYVNGWKKDWVENNEGDNAIWQKTLTKENTTRYFALGKDSVSGVPLLLNDIKRIYFAPFAYDRRNDGDSDYLVENIFIDFDDLEKEKERSVGSTKFKVKQYKVAYDNIGLENEKKFNYFTYKGVINWPESSDFNGKIVYGISVTLTDKSTEDEILKTIAWQLDHTTAVDEELKVVWQMYFDPSTLEEYYVQHWGMNKDVSGWDYDDDIKNSGGAYPTLGAIVEFRPRCTEFTSVYNDAYIPSEKFGGTNKAWTDRVWKYSSLDNYDYSIGRSIDREVLSTSPYGPATLSSSQLTTDNKDILRKYYYQDSADGKAIDGFPYLCSAAVWLGQNLAQGSGLLPTIFDPKVYVCPALKKVSVTYKLILDGFPYVTNSADLDYSSPETFATEGRIFLNEFFVKAYKVIAPENNNDKFVLKNVWDDAERATGTQNWQIPKVYSLNPYNCFTDDKQSCSAWKSEAVTINRRNYETSDYNGDGVDEEDTDFDGLSDPMIFVGTAGVNLSFFAAAEDNRMPLRRVMVDWRDGNLVNEKQFGFYKNRKPFCETSDSSALPTVARCQQTQKNQITCQNDTHCAGMNADCDDLTTRFFGDAARACVSRPFEFTHYYSCTSADTSTTVSDLKRIDPALSGLSQAEVDKIKQIASAQGSASGLGSNPKVCVFRPRVQVMDNWGFCNGSCGSSFCYSDGATDECSPRDPNNNIIPGDSGPWTYYRGAIVVLAKD